MGGTAVGVGGTTAGGVKGHGSKLQSLFNPFSKVYPVVEYVVC